MLKVVWGGYSGRKGSRSRNWSIFFRKESELYEVVGEGGEVRGKFLLGCGEISIFVRLRESK